MFGEIRNKQGERLDYAFHTGRGDAKRIVVIGHGVTGNKDRPFVVALGETLSKAGIPALRFSFSGNGASGGKFAESTISKEIEDLGSVFDQLNAYDICYAGHSMGGAVGVVRASRDERIRCLISLAGMVHTKAFAEREFGRVQPGAGFMWDDPNCPLSQTYMDDMNRIASVAELAGKIHVPWLLVHGTEDDVVPLQDSLDIFAQANVPKELFKLQGSNHVFAGEFTVLMVRTVETWLQQHWPQ